MLITQIFSKLETFGHSGSYTTNNKYQNKTNTVFAQLNKAVILISSAEEMIIGFCDCIVVAILIA